MEDTRLFALFGKCGSLEWSDEAFVLKSGLRSNLKVHLGREDVKRHPELVRELGLLVLKALEGFGFARDAKLLLVGVPRAGAILAQAAVRENLDEKRFSQLSWDVPRAQVELVRELREDGTMADRRLWLDDFIDPGAQVVVVENVVTTGGAVLKVVSRLMESGGAKERTSVLALVDRELNGRARIKEAQLRYLSRWDITELVLRCRDALPEGALSVLRGEIDEFHDDPPFSA